MPSIIVSKVEAEIQKRQLEERRRVSSVVEHSSTDPKGPGSTLDPSHNRVMHYDPHLPKGCGCKGFLSPMHKKIPDSYSKREGGCPGNSGLSS